MPGWLTDGLAGALDLPLLQEYGYRLWIGLLLTMQVVAISCSLGFVLSWLIARGRMSRRLVVAWPVLAYVTFFRGTPLLCQLYLVYYGAGQLRPALQEVGLWWFFRDSYFCCLLVFTLNTAAYQGEIIRGAIKSVPKGQTEAARALGLSPWRIARHVVGPQAMLVALRPLGNELISIIKASALAAIVTLLDLMGQTRFVFAHTFDFMVYLYASLIYLALTEAIGRLWNWMERGLSRHLVPTGQPAALRLPAAEARTVGGLVTEALPK